MAALLRSRGARLVAATALTIGAARSVAAQGPGLFDVFVSRKEQPSDPLFGGIALGGYRGLIGFRVSGGLHFTNDDGRNTTTVQPTVRCDRFGCRRGPGGRTQYQDGSLFGANVGGWTADADLLIAPLRAFPVAKSLLGFSPYAFVGIGGTGIRPNNAADTTRSTLSYGLGAHHDLLGRLGVTAEARYRRPLASDSALTLGSRRDWEYRVGFSVSFGGGRSTPKEAPRVIVARPIETQPVPDAELAAPDASAAALPARVIDAADDLLAIRYRAGGTKPETGFDAVGFVQYVFGEVGVRLPDSAREMARLGREVSTRVGALRPGDLLFFANDGTNINHVAIYAGQERIIHATASGGGVRYDTLGEGERGEWFADHLVTARRVTRTGGRDATER